jgi:predicted RNase H-like nuclease (RuvC/YqgF family)
MMPVMSDGDMINLKQDVDRHEQVITEDAIQIAALKSEIDDLKDGIRELIEAVEDLHKAQRNAGIASNETTSLDTSWTRIAGLKKRFSVKEEAG